jgi:hypothetical protein
VGTHSDLEENHEGCGVTFRVYIYAESWRVLDQVEEMKYQPWFHEAHRLSYGHHMAQMEFFLSKSVI